MHVIKTVLLAMILYHAGAGAYTYTQIVDGTLDTDDKITWFSGTVQSIFPNSMVCSSSYPCSFRLTEEDGGREHYRKSCDTGTLGQCSYDFMITVTSDRLSGGRTGRHIVLIKPPWEDNVLHTMNTFWVGVSPTTCTAELTKSTLDLGVITRDTGRISTPFSDLSVKCDRDSLVRVRAKVDEVGANKGLSVSFGTGTVGDFMDVRVQRNVKKSVPMAIELDTSNSKLDIKSHSFVVVITVTLI